MNVIPSNLPRIPGFPNYAVDLKNNNVYSFCRNKDGKAIAYLNGWQGQRLFQLWENQRYQYKSMEQIRELLDAEYRIRESARRQTNRNEPSKRRSISFHVSNGMAEMIKSATLYLQKLNADQAYYVAIIEQGSPKFSSNPKKHLTLRSAETEAERLAKLNTGSAYGVFQMVNQVMQKVERLAVHTLNGLMLEYFVARAIISTNLYTPTTIPMQEDYKNQLLNHIIHSGNVTITSGPSGFITEINTISMPGSTLIESTFRAFVASVFGINVDRPSDETFLQVLER